MLNETEQHCNTTDGQTSGARPNGGGNGLPTQAIICITLVMLVS